MKSYIQRPQFELFDISSGPAETRNLAELPQHVVLLKWYQEKLKAAQKETGDPWIMKWVYE